LFIQRSARSRESDDAPCWEAVRVFKLIYCAAALLLAACTPIMDDDVRTVARAAAEARFAAECGAMEVPPRAFLPLDLTGDGRDDYMLSFARVRCENSASLWTGTGGPLFQLWTDDGGRPRMVLEENMHAFRHDLKSRYLVTDQHGANCPGGAGPQICRVVYRWDNAADALTVVDRKFMPAEPLPGQGNITTWVQPSAQAKASGAPATTFYRSLSIQTDPHTHN
jgi:hypothetical protein